MRSLGAAVEAGHVTVERRLGSGVKRREVLVVLQGRVFGELGDAEGGGGRGFGGDDARDHGNASSVSHPGDRRREVGLEQLVSELQTLRREGGRGLVDLGGKLERVDYHAAFAVVADDDPRGMDGQEVAAQSRLVQGGVLGIGPQDGGASRRAVIRTAGTAPPALPVF